MNHVPRKEDLGKVARSVARALRPGGYFFFDVNNREAFQRYWTLTFWLEQPGLVTVMRGGHKRGSDRAWCDVEMFVQEGKLWRRRTEHVDEVCWSPGEIRGALRQAGFAPVRAWDAGPFFKNDPVVRAGCRTVYLARKAGG